MPLLPFPVLPRTASLATALALSAPMGAALAQQAPAAPATGGDTAWRRCAAITDSGEARLACFDQWAASASVSAPAAPSATASAAAASATPADSGNAALPKPVDATLPATRIIEVAQTDGCRDEQYSALSRFWELESGSDCGSFRFRGYRPISVSLTKASSVNRQPSSDAPGHTAASATDYRSAEMRVQLSVRTKLAQNILTSENSNLRDSLWLGYSQQSYWQVFSPAISRPFRATDHEPEVIYVYPTTAQLPFGWRWRYSGLGLVHQSNGQSLPLSRSWNRAYVMTGIELDNRWTVGARLWKRLHESAADDDNPGISNYMGRGEMTVSWQRDRSNTFILTGRHSLGGAHRGSARLEWLQTLGQNMGAGKSNLRLHTAIFSGYGDSLIDYNRKRTVFSVGLSLVDF